MGKRFRKLLESGKTILRPCAYDALSAILIENAGFSLVGTSGYGISASLIGQPDIGLLGYHEILERTRTIVNAVRTPVDVDVDTGYGNAMNAYWTVLNFTRVGAAGIRIEDQVWPKRCGHMEGKQIVSREEMVSKIKAAFKARDEEDPALVLGARTDARAVAGIDEAIERAVIYAEAGADYVYVEAPQTLEEVERLVRSTPVPICLNIIPGGRTPPFRVDDLEARGVRYISVPMVALYAATKAMVDSLNELRTTRDMEKLGKMGVTWSEFNELVGQTRWRSLELDCLPEEELEKRYGTKDLGKITERERALGKKWEM